MAIQIKDYYEILGVSRDAGDDEVRRAFRNLARQYHPDKAGNNRQAEDRFKEINEAYEVLGDARKRHRYDEFNNTCQNRSADEAWEKFAQSHGGNATGQGNTHFTFSGGGFSEFFDELFGERSTRSTPRSSAPREDNDQRGDDLEADIWVSLNEVAQGAVRQVTLRRSKRCDTCLGMGQVSAEKCEACEGKGSFPAAIACKVKIPRGIREGSLLRIAGKGEDGLAGGPPGDLYLKVRYSPHSEFRHERGSLVYELEVAPWEAVLGASLSVPTLDGRVAIRVPPGTRGSQKLRVRGHGLPLADGTPGDLMVRIKIQVPAAASGREHELWEELARESAFRPRDH